jgi:hypothetical protein
MRAYNRAIRPRVSDQSRMSTQWYKQVLGKLEAVKPCGTIHQLPEMRLAGSSPRSSRSEKVSNRGR